MFFIIMLEFVPLFEATLVYAIQETQFLPVEMQIGLQQLRNVKPEIFRVTGVE